MKKLLLFTILTISLGLKAQNLLTENSTALSVGNVGTDLTGVTQGQGGWLTTASGGANTDFQIVNKGGVYGNAIQITGSAVATSTKFMTKNISANWTSRTSGNDIAQIEFNFFTGPVSTSKNTMRITLYDSAARTKMLAGLFILMDTKEVRGLAYLDPTTLGGTGAIGNYSLTLGGTAATPAALILSPDTWYRFGYSFNFATGEVKFREVMSSLFDRSFACAASGVNPIQIDIIGTAGTGNLVSSIGVFDNILIKASATDTLLGTEKVSLDSSIFSFSPNPTSDFVNISNSDNIKVSSVKITDLNGRVVKQNNFDSVSDIKINVSDLSSGIYMMNINSNEGSVTKKIIKN